MDLSGVGRALVVFGLVLAVVGALLLLMGKGVLPRVPGTLTFGRGPVRVLVPVGLSILLSIALTVMANLFFRR